MTIEEFKQKYPQYKDLENDELWNKMEDMLLLEQSKRKKKYTLRWLFYRNKSNLSFGKNNYTASEICSNCKKGVSSCMGFLFDGKYTSYCPHCSKELYKEPNKSIWYWLHTKKELFWKALDWLHICRNVVGGRYDMFNDEHYFVKFTEYKNWEYVSTEYRKRKWYEYLIIER